MSSIGTFDVSWRKGGGGPSTRNTQLQTKRTNDVALQCFLYVAAFVGTFFWTMVLKFMDSREYNASHEAKLFPLRVLNGLLPPSTGFWNLCIYLRPGYAKTRSDFPDESNFWAVKRALYGEVIPPTVDEPTDPIPPPPPVCRPLPIDQSLDPFPGKSGVAFQTRQFAELETDDQPSDVLTSSSACTQDPRNG